MSRSLCLTALEGIPIVKSGDDLAEIIIVSLDRMGLTLENGDVLVLAQKIVSKSEGRYINLSTVQASEKARELAILLEKRPELVECILQESNEVLRTRPGTIIVEQKNGFVCANAGIDHSNIHGPWGAEEDWVLLLPEDSDLSAATIRASLEKKYNCHLAVLIIDSHGRAWRNGVVGVCIGCSGMPALVDMRGQDDLYNYKLRVTTIAAADELAAGASLLMGQAREGTPVVLVRGFPYEFREGSSKELLREKERDLFR